jgi:hypothetical protein
MTAKKLELEEFEEKIFLLLLGEGKTIEQLHSETGIGYNKLLPKIKKLLTEKRIKKMSGFPTRFELEKESERTAKKILAKKDFSDLEQITCEIK